MKVLIVDGSKDRRRELVQHLAALGNIVIQGAVPDMRSAMTAVLDASPDVLVTGAVLPDGHSTQLVERVRRIAHTSIVVLASPDCPAERARFLAAGADAYVDTAELPRAIEGLGRIGSDAIAAEDSQRLLGRMAAGVIHDLNNYLNIIEVTMRLLRRAPADEAQALWQQMRRTVDAIARMTAQVLTYAHGGQVAPELVDVGVIARDVLGLCARIIPATIAIEVDVADGSRITGIRSELEQMLLNLVINACDAMPEGGNLAVTVRKLGKRVVLSVADTGHGLGAGPPKRGGHGLGLGIVRGVVERHRGELHVVVGDTGGTAVTISLPR